ncbi:MAG TPA: FUSC family protein [Edaphobacter sp.]|nr:FUSC family protein [Edaphobacter sp.]
METTSVRLPHATRFTTWFPDFLRKELAPYPGRGAIVARMVVAASITAILIVTFRIPGGAIGVLSAFLLSRESLQSTAQSTLALGSAFVLGGLFIPIGSRFFASVPITHFLWEGISLFIVFFLLRTLTNFLVAINIGAIATAMFAIWYLPGPGEKNVELSLWQVLAALIGTVVTLAVEVVFHAIHHDDELVVGVEVRLQHIEALMEDYAANRPVSPETTRMLAQYAVVGVGALRRELARRNQEAIQRMRTSALVSLTGRAIDFAAALSNTLSNPTPQEQQRAAKLAQRIAEMRRFLQTNKAPSRWEAPVGSAGTPLFTELEAMVSLMSSVFVSESSIDPRLEVLESPPSSNRIFVQDAFSNPEHLPFVLGGTLAAMLCYVLYVSLDWPGISTSVTTCVFTALASVGTSRQKQVLRIAGAVLGGFVFGIGSQMFILPNIDSITGFIVLFAVVSAIAAWVSTSSSRLSYAGLQIALAFYLITLNEFHFQTSLALARDRAVGVLLGGFAMWLVFERLYPRPAGDEMVRIFISNLRLLAELVNASPAGTDTEAIIRIRRQRDQVYRYFNDVNSQADAVPFETGPARVADMAARDRIRRWQASLRTFYLLEAPLIQFRVFGDVSMKSRPFAQMHDIFREQCARSFGHMAENLENQLNKRPHDGSIPRSLMAPLEDAQAVERATFSEREEALLRMLRTMASLVDRMQNEVASEPLYGAA